MIYINTEALSVVY